MGAVTKPVEKVVKEVGGAIGIGGGGSAPQPSPASPAAPAAPAPKAPLAQLVTAAQVAKDTMGGQLRKRGRAANILAGESAGNIATQTKRLLGE
jgi:hypothetical protein